MGLTPCVGCEVSCCKEYVVQLNGHDIYRLCASVELPVREYIELRRSEDRGGVLLKDSAKMDFYELTLAHGPRGCVFRCFRHQLLLPHPYLVLTKPLRLDIQCQRAASVKIGWKYLDD